MIAKKGYKVCLRHSLMGIRNILRAKVIFYNVNLSDVSVFLVGTNSIKINLWHGIGLKKVGHSNDGGATSYIYTHRNFVEYVFKYFSYLDCYIRPNYLISTTLHQSEPYTKAFRIPLDKCLNFGTPRTDIFFKSNDEILNIKDLMSDKYFVQYIQKQKKYERIFIYMPTWREDGRDFFDTVKIDFYKLNILLEKSNALLILKLHPYTKADSFKLADLSNIEFYDNQIELYAYLPFTDVLITDYSSIYYDYLLLNKQTILYLPDIESYTSNSRSFVYDFEESTASPKAYNFKQLINLIEKLSGESNENHYNNYKTKEKKIIDLFWGEYNGDASKKIFDFISKQVINEF